MTNFFGGYVTQNHLIKYNSKVNIYDRSLLTSLIYSSLWLLILDDLHFLFDGVLSGEFYFFKKFYKIIFLKWKKICRFVILKCSLPCRFLTICFRTQANFWVTFLKRRCWDLLLFFTKLYFSQRNKIQSSG